MLNLVIFGHIFGNDTSCVLCSTYSAQILKQTYIPFGTRWLHFLNSHSHRQTFGRNAGNGDCRQHLPCGEKIDGDRHSQKLENRMQGHDKLIRLMGVAIAIDPFQVVYSKCVY